MAEVRNVFIKSKMNKDLDERLLPPGEYRDGQNISVNKSEGPDEGVVENILGNSLYSSFNFGTNVEIIGTHVDTDTDRIYVFATNHSDGSPNQMDARAIGNVDTASGRFTQSAVCVIAYIEGPTASSGNVSKSDILVSGTFLNFSKTHPILGIDIIEDLLFFTDNRNQPRKINVETAIGNSATSPEPYYTNEDHISVAKICPVDPIRFIYQVGGAYVSGLMDETSEYLPANSTSVLTGSLPSVGQLAFAVGNPQLSTSLNGLVRFKNLNSLKGEWEIDEDKKHLDMIAYYEFGADSTSGGFDKLGDAEKEEARKYKESVKGVLEEIATEEGPGEVWKSLANVFLSHKKTIDAINPNSSVQRAVWSMGGGFWNNGTINVSHKGPGSKEHILLHELAHHFSVPYLRKYFLDGHYNKDLYTNHPERLAPESGAAIS